MILSQKNKEEQLDNFSIYKTETESQQITNLENWSKDLKKSVIENSPKIKITQENESKNILKLPKIGNKVENNEENEEYTPELNNRLPRMNSLVMRKKISNFVGNFNIDEDNLVNSINKNIEQILNQKFEHDSYVKQGNFYKKIDDIILNRINIKIKDLDSMFIKKNKNLLLFRKENSIILSKMKSLKQNVIFFIFNIINKN